MLGFWNFVFFSVWFVTVELGTFLDLGILANENLVNTIAKEQLEQFCK